MIYFDEITRIAFHVCIFEEYSDTAEEDSEKLFCNADWHFGSCWSPVDAGILAFIPCPVEFQGMSYTYAANAIASRQCFENASWDSYINYTECIASAIPDLNSPVSSGPSADVVNLISTVLHYFGYSLSLASCLLALCIYAKFRTLCRLRNVIHLNLITTYVFSAVIWMAMTSCMKGFISQSSLLSEETPEVKQQTTALLFVLIIAFVYFQTTTFYWTFCEGIYMTCILFKPHKLEQLTFWPFGALGWLLPAIIVLIWAPVKLHFEGANGLLRMSSAYDWIFITPILVGLAVNLMLLFLSLHTILRKQSGRSSQSSSAWGRGARSFLILLPLLGLTYAVVIIQPHEPPTVKAIFQISTAVLLPIQGFFVAVLYCFCNRQVRGLLNVHCYRKLLRHGCFHSPNGEMPSMMGKDNDASSANNQNYDLRNFRGNTNEWQYYLRTRKSHERFARTESFKFDTDSVRLNRMSSRTRKNAPVLVV